MPPIKQPSVGAPAKIPTSAPKAQAPKDGKPASAPTGPIFLPAKKGEGSPLLGMGERKLVYPKLLVNGVEIPQDKTIIPVALAKKLLGWETEEEYGVRITKGVEDPDLRAEREALAKRGFASSFLLKDPDGKKVRCWHNDTNRPFDESHALRLAQDILNKNWAGYLSMPGETINGEAIIISRTGRVESGQHRLIALILASMIWAKNKHKHAKTWPTEPFIESLLVYGISESERVVRTLDNVKPRALSDVIFTSTLFAALDIGGRKECSRMLQYATQLLWRRTQAGKIGSETIYQTHSESIEFITRHPKIKDCIKHLYTEDKDRGISSLRLTTGECAGLLYLQGSCASDVDVYRNLDPLPAEKCLDWKHWDKARRFWSDLAKKSLETLREVRSALGMLQDAESGTGGRRAEKHAILAKAWTQYVQGYEVKKADLKLAYAEDRNGNMVLCEPGLSFGGIDLGDKPPKLEEEQPSEEEVEAAKAEAVRRKQAKIEAARAKKNGKK